MFVILAIILVILVVIYVKWTRNYWRRHNVQQLSSTHILFGDFKPIIFQTQPLFDYSRHIYNYFKEKNVRYGGLYSISRKIFFTVDPELVKHVLVKDFDYFMDHGLQHNEQLEPLSANLFNLEGARWKAMRQKLTPTFTSGKMKMMFPTVMSCAAGLKNIIEEHAVSREPIEIKDVLARFTTDIIGNCAFGIECNSMKDPNSEFRMFGKKIFERSLFHSIKASLVQAFPQSVATSLGIRIMDHNVEKFFLDMVINNAEYREKNQIFRKDFFQLMLQLKNLGKVTDDETITSPNKSGESFLSMNEVAAQCFVFFAGGFETSSNVMAFTLYELALNQEIQSKVRETVNKVLDGHNGEITYESIQEMTYLENAINEAMRKYPVLPILPRISTKRYKIPDSDLVLEAGTRVWIPVAGLHWDPNIYPDPERYDPDRFSEQNQALKSNPVYLPFGEGPRQCIGLRFGMLQSKIGLASILRNFKVTLNAQTATPLAIKPVFLTTARDDIYLDFEKIELN
ncbi:cytochrome P450 6a2-like isoform X2 [Cylas formicarius]|nr:cytochrome P450 6a2-like isoform X2 [Cylas formicarius]